jgi:hypothetical protein
MNRDNYPSEIRIIRNLFLAAAPFLSIGLFGCWWGMSMWAEYESMKSWVEVPAIIKTTNLENHSSHKHTRYDVFATYDYEFNKQKYSGDRVTLLKGLMNEGTFNREAHDELKPHRVQQTPFHCYVNPEVPQESILYRNLPGFPLVMSTLLATIPGSIGMALLIVAVQILLFGPKRSHANVASDNGNTGLVVFWAIMGSYWCIATLPLDRKIIESISNGGGIDAWLALVFPLIGLLILSRAFVFLFESSPSEDLAYEPNAAVGQSFESAKL